MPNIEPFQISVPDSALADLKARLKNTRFPDEVPDTGWEYGTNLAYLKELVEYWRDKYDWRTHERQIASRISRRMSMATEFISSTKRARDLHPNRSC